MSRGGFISDGNIYVGYILLLKTNPNNFIHQLLTQFIENT